MIYILIAILIFGILIAVHEFGHFITAKLLGVQVNEFSIGMGPAIFSKTKGETLYSLRVLPIGGFCAMEGEDEDSDNPRAFGAAAGWKKLIILVAGAWMNFVTGLLICCVLMAGAAAFVEPVVAGFVAEYPQEMVGEAGLMEGDRILSVNGERIYLYSDITLFFSRSNGETMNLVIERNGQRVYLNDYPLHLREWTEEGQTVTRYGVNFSVSEATFASKLKNSWLMAIDFVRLVRFSLQELFTGGAGLQDLTGPVGIVDTMSQVGSESKSMGDAVYYILYLAALIAVNLAVMNLLPLPALDGGRIFFLILNGICALLFRRRIPSKYEGYVHMAGMVLLLGLMVVVTFSDIGKIVSRFMAS